MRARGAYHGGQEALNRRAARSGQERARMFGAGGVMQGAS